MDKMHLLWIIPLTIFISIMGVSALSYQSDKEVFILGTTLACYDGCFNMLEVLDDNDDKNWGDNSIEKLHYDICSHKCDVSYFDSLLNSNTDLTIENMIKSRGFK